VSVNLALMVERAIDTGMARSPLMATKNAFARSCIDLFCGVWLGPESAL
jgi:hypothetical protein